MKLLFVSAFYPPREIGGWEQLTQEMVDGLRRRGHDVRVLTSVFGGGGSLPSETHVSRTLRLDNDQYRYRPWHFFLRRPVDASHNRATLMSHLRQFAPQAVMFHSMWNLSRQLPWLAEQALPGRVAYYVADYWPCEPGVDEAYWVAQQERAALRGWRRAAARWPLRALQAERARYQLAFENLIYVSHAVQQQLLERGCQPALKGRVIHNGVDLNVFSPAASAPAGADRHLLFAGSLAPHKGLLTVLEALRRLNQDSALEPIKLRVAGSGHEDHLRQIEETVQGLGLGGQVTLLGRVARAEMPGLYRKAYALVFPSIWPEPLARATQEAMACSLPVVATPTGGTAELIENEVNGLTFGPENAVELAAQLKRLWLNPALAAELGQAARRTVEARFDIQLTVSNIEAYCAELARSHGRS